ncbi:hypothetical protein Q5H93_18215 [Hymenobacter sp. ASUV-10]|uniref:Uncharacterized protein n=1 Tax=Hymenobacter aranciens TaxID=3063996 RepID=A0ABT9BJ61_9BACT|nr:hypothetical protein [Hymenobacter sp. ASUV-10]MDO7876686.1 hypothetical protein [Hymenobacter sp. ASUV-10]
MSPILVEPLSEQAYELLRQLEALHILRVLSNTEIAAPRKTSIASLIGTLSPKTSERMLKEVAEMRNEWEREF